MRDFLAVMQEKGAIRKDIDIDAMAYIMDALSASFVDSRIVGNSHSPNYEALLQTMADMLDRMLTPEDGGNLEAGKQIIRDFAANAQHYLSRTIPAESEFDS